MIYIYATQSSSSLTTVRACFDSTTLDTLSLSFSSSLSITRRFFIVGVSASESSDRFRFDSAREKKNLKKKRIS